jgi:uncharacterized protein YjaZ
LTTNSSDTNHGAIKISQLEPKTTVSKKAKSDAKKEEKIATVDKIQEPLIPINRPKRVQVKKLRKGKIRIQKYIKVFIVENRSGYATILKNEANLTI